MTHGDRIVIDNSGVILLWPFLTAYFERAGLMVEDAFVSEVHQQRAVYLLQYLVYTNTDVAAYELPLHKILVGMLIEHRIQPISGITHEEQELSESLLHGFIANWKKVENSSIESIQETFLKREGLLTIHADSYVLNVEQKGVDLLMTSIPWNFEVIQLPWMDRVLRVEWL